MAVEAAGCSSRSPSRHGQLITKASGIFEKAQGWNLESKFLSLFLSLIMFNSSNTVWNILQSTLPHSRSARLVVSFVYFVFFLAG